MISLTAFVASITKIDFTSLITSATNILLTYLESPTKIVAQTPFRQFQSWLFMF